MNKFIVLLTMMTLGLFASVSMAATTEVKWENPDDYRDVDAGEGHRAKFKARVFADFEKHFTMLAKKLPEGQTLKIKVTDVDLAGDVHQSMRRIRIVKDLFFPRMTFSYQVVDADNREVSAGNVELKDMNFMMGGTGLRYNQDNLGYEKRMLDKWFRETFLK
ncbi:DUF3016 domain-containing protein [Colwelliaceae bacterium 6441]